MPDMLVYRDLLGAASEGFVARQYCGFDTLTPYFIGTRGTPPGAGELLASGPLGRFRVRQLGGSTTALDRWVGEHRPRLLHAQFGLGGALALPLARRWKLPLFVTFHGGDATKEKHYRRRFPPTIYQRRMRAMVEEARLIFCVSDFIRDTLIRRGFPPAKLLTHYLGIDLPPSDVLVPWARNANTVLFVGRLVDKKGVATLLDAMALVQRDDPALELAIVGDGPLRASLEERARALPGKVKFLGWHTPELVRQRMRESSMLVVPSQRAGSGDSEGLGLVTLEAQAVGLPVIGSRHGGIPEAVQHEQTGLLFAEGDAQALAAQILRLRQQVGLAEQLREAAWVRLREDFDAKKQSAWLQQILLSMTA